MCYEPGRRSAAKLLTKDEARRIASNIAKLPRVVAENVKSRAAARTFLLIVSEVMSPRFLNKDEFTQVIRNTPLVAIDVIIRDPDQYVLVGLRTNEPAKGKGLRFRSSLGAHALPMPSIADAPRSTSTPLIVVRHPVAEKLLFRRQMVSPKPQQSGGHDRPKITLEKGAASHTLSRRSAEQSATTPLNLKSVLSWSSATSIPKKEDGPSLVSR